MSHLPLKSGLSSQIPWAVEKGQLSEVACYYCQVPPCLCQPLSQRVSGSPAALGHLGTIAKLSNESEVELLKTIETAASLGVQNSQC